MTRRELALAGVALATVGTMAFHSGKTWAQRIRVYPDGTFDQHENLPDWAVRQGTTRPDGTLVYEVCPAGAICQDEWLDDAEWRGGWMTLLTECDFVGSRTMRMQEDDEIVRLALEACWSLRDNKE